MAWVLTPSKVSRAQHYLYWKVLCTSDGNALSATDIISSTYMGGLLKAEVQGTTLMAMKVSPGTAGVIPDVTIDVTLSDSESDAIFTMTGASKDAISWHDLSIDIGMYPTIFENLYLTINDIGALGDQITLYFISWVEDK